MDSRHLGLLGQPRGCQMLTVRVFVANSPRPCDFCRIVDCAVQRLFVGARKSHNAQLQAHPSVGAGVVAPQLIRQKSLGAQPKEVPCSSSFLTIKEAVTSPFA